MRDSFHPGVHHYEGDRGREAQRNQRDAIASRHKAPGMLHISAHVWVLESREFPGPGKLTHACAFSCYPETEWLSLNLICFRCNTTTTTSCCCRCCYNSFYLNFLPSFHINSSVCYLLFVVANLDFTSFYTIISYVYHSWHKKPRSLSCDVKKQLTHCCCCCCRDTV